MTASGRLEPLHTIDRRRWQQVLLLRIYSVHNDGQLTPTCSEHTCRIRIEGHLGTEVSRGWLMSHLWQPWVRKRLVSADWQDTALHTELVFHQHTHSPCPGLPTLLHTSRLLHSSLGYSSHSRISSGFPKEYQLFLLLLDGEAHIKWFLDPISLFLTQSHGGYLQTKDSGISTNGSLPVHYLEWKSITWFLKSPIIDPKKKWWFLYKGKRKGRWEH